MPAVRRAPRAARPATVRPPPGTTYSPLIVSAYFYECGLPPPVYEYRHVPGRMYRVDIAWPQYQVGIEVQGGLWTGGRHVRGAGARADMDKHNAALLAGWSVLYVEPRALMTGATVEMALTLIRRAAAALPV